MYLLYLAITSSGILIGMFVGIGNGSWSFIALPGCTGVSGPGTDGAECVDGLVHVVVDCNGTGMDKPRVAGGNGTGSKGVSIGGPGVANGTKDVVGGPLGGKFAVCPCKPRIC